MRAVPRLAWLVALAGLLFVVPLRAPAAAASATVPAGFADSLFATGFGGRLTSMTFGPDGRLYVSQKEGAIRIVDSGGTLLSDPFITLSTATDNELGVKGIAFDPNYASNGYVYVYYTNATTLKNRVSRFSRLDTNHLDPTTEKVLVDGIDSGIYHDGGSLHFGPDGKLYISTGDASYPPSSQGFGNLDGKILRINTDGTIPSDNPFINKAGARPQIWALGLRNPFTFAFNNAGRLFINDVGESTWEEIDDGIEGANYGWPTCEGVCNTPGFTDPIYTYNHEAGPGKSITGGTFYEATMFPPAYRGKYFFGDYVGNYINSFDPATGAASSFATGAMNPVDLDVGPDGALYYLSVEAKQVHRISYTSSGPTPTPTPTPTSSSPQSANLVSNPSFESTASPWRAPWKTVVRSPARASFAHVSAASSGKYSIRATVTRSNQDWFAQLLQPNIALLAHHTYTLSFSARASALRPVRVALQQNSGSYPLYFQQTFSVGTGWQTFTTTFEAPTTDAKALLAFNFGDRVGRLWIDAVSLTTGGAIGQTPAPVISLPATGTTYYAGQTLSFAGSATDPEDGALPASALTWEIVFHHDTHTHPFIEPFSGVTSGTFQIPDTGEVSSNTWYRVHLRATDSDGNVTEVTRDITPLKSNVTLQTVPTGLTLTLTGIPVTAPNMFTGVVGFKRELGAAATQTLNGTTYRFVGWSDGGAATHTIATPSVATTYTAYYEPASSNLVTNGGFDIPSGGFLAGGWNTVIRSPASATFARDTADFSNGPAAFRADLANTMTPANDWYVQLLHPNVALTSGQQYTLSFAAKATTARSIRVALHQNSGSYTAYFDKSVAIGTSWQTYTVVFTAGTSDPAALLAFNLAGATGSVWLDDVSVVSGS